MHWRYCSLLLSYRHDTARRGTTYTYPKALDYSPHLLWYHDCLPSSSGIWYPAVKDFQTTLAPGDSAYYTICVLGNPWDTIHASNHASSSRYHDDVIKWKHFPRYWPFVRGIHRSPVNSPHKGQWRGALMFSLICARINGWVNNPEAGDLRRHPTHCDVIVMLMFTCISS